MIPLRRATSNFCCVLRHLESNCTLRRVSLGILKVISKFQNLYVEDLEIQSRLPIFAEYSNPLWWLVVVAFLMKVVLLVMAVMMVMLGAVFGGGGGGSGGVCFGVAYSRSSEL